ncbi:hypothetical protein BH18ACI1_BH18ACI1_20820 [soil metagenome]
MNLTQIKQVILFVGISLFVFTNAFAQNLTPNQTIVAKADEYMNAAEKIDGFSGAVLVARDGQPVFSKAYGMANYELDVPNKPQTVYRIGSITKQFTSMAIMMLQERGKLNVNDSICKHLSDCPETWKPIAVRNLLTHTSGIINYGELPEFRNPATLINNAETIITLLKNKPLEFAPGEKFAYSNSGYILLGMIVERTSGKDYDVFLQENIFVPLGMKNTGENGSIRIVKNRASGYFRQADTISNAALFSMRVAWSAGSMFSTTEDLLLWDKALYTEKLVSRKSLDEMFIPFRDFLPGTGYAYGWMIGKQFDRQVMSHSGHVAGFSSSIIRFPADHVTVIVLSNNINAPSVSIGNALAAIVFGASYKSPNERKTIALEPQALEKYAGQYQLAAEVILAITIANKRIIGRITGLGNIELFAKSETDFFSKQIDAQIAFTKDAQGKVTGLTMHSGGCDISAQKIK